MPNPKRFAALIACCLLGMSPSAAPSASSGGAPALAFEEDAHDFGRVTAGSVLPYTFRFTNIGGRTLRIHQVKPTCVCTRVVFWDRAVEPGRTGRISVQLDTRGLRADNRRSIQVETNAPGQSTLLLYLTVSVQGVLQVEPQQVDFGMLYPEKRPFQQTVEITNRGDRSIPRLAASSSTPVFQTRLVPIKPGYQWKLQIGVRGNPRPGLHAGIITLAGGPQSGDAVVPVSATVPEPVEIRPRRIFLPAAVAARPVTRTLIIRRADGARLRITATSASASGIRMRIRPEALGRIIRVQVVFPAGFTLPESGAELRFRTDLSAQPQITVQVTADRPGPTPVR